MRTIELLGTPGSGKSTLARALPGLLADSGIGILTLREAIGVAMKRGMGDRVMDPLVALLSPSLLANFSEKAFLRSTASLGSLVEFMYTRPRVMEVVLGAQVRRADFEVGRKLIIQWFAHLASAYQFVASALDDETIVLLTEGFCQRSITVFGHHFGRADHPELEIYLDAIPAPSVLVHLAIDTNDAIERLDRIGRIGSKRFAGAEASDQFVADAARCVSHVASQVESLDWPMVEADATAEPTDIAESVAGQVAALLGASQLSGDR